MKKVCRKLRFQLAHSTAAELILEVKTIEVAVNSFGYRKEQRILQTFPVDSTDQIIKV
jgi:hypothetical protein